MKMNFAWSYSLFTTFVLSMVMNNPYDSTRFTLPEIISPTFKLSKLFLADCGKLLALNDFKVTSTLFDKGSTDDTLHLSFLVRVHHWTNFLTISKKKFPSMIKINKIAYLPVTSFPTGNSFSRSSTYPSDKLETRILASSFRESKIKHPFDETFFT